MPYKAGTCRVNKSVAVALVMDDKEDTTKGRYVLAGHLQLGPIATVQRQRHPSTRGTKKAEPCNMMDT